MSDKPKSQMFYVQDPFTEDVRGPLSASDLRQWFSTGGLDDWGVAKSPTGPWTPASQVKGLSAPTAPAALSAVTTMSAATSNSSLSNGGSVGNSTPRTNSEVSGTFGGLLKSQSSGKADGLERLKRNPFALMIGGGCLLLALGIASDNPVIGGAGLWTAIAGAVLPLLRSKFPKVFSAATPLSAGAVVALVIGTLVLLASMNADTTVDSGTSFGRVHNIGLMNQQRNGITFGAILMAAGLAMGGLHLHHKRGAGSASHEGESKSCPKCGENVKRAAVFCKHCKSDI